MEELDELDKLPEVEVVKEEEEDNDDVAAREDDEAAEDDGEKEGLEDEYRAGEEE